MSEQVGKIRGTNQQHGSYNIPTSLNAQIYNGNPRKMHMYIATRQQQQHTLHNTVVRTYLSNDTHL